MLRSQIGKGSTRERIMGERGQGLVEYALVLPVFLMLVFFIIDSSFIIYQKTIFDSALRETVFGIEFEEDIKSKLNPYAQPTPYGDSYNQKRVHEFYVDQEFKNGTLLSDYLKSGMIEKSGGTLNPEKISFGSGSGTETGKVSIYTGKQYYDYQKKPDSHKKELDKKVIFSTIVVADFEINYSIAPFGPFYRLIYPDGIKHSKKVYKASRDFRWRPRVVDPVWLEEWEDD